LGAEEPWPASSRENWLAGLGNRLGTDSSSFRLQDPNVMFQNIFHGRLSTMNIITKALLALGQI
jgi:hypothetical protein